MAEDAETPSGAPAEPSTPQPLDVWAESCTTLPRLRSRSPRASSSRSSVRTSAVEVARKAATQKRHMILIGEPGTGKSMLARAMVDFLPKEPLQDILAYPNSEDSNEPKIRVVPAGKGKEIVAAQKLEAAQKKEQRTILFIVVAIAIMAFTLYLIFTTGQFVDLIWGLLVVVLLYAIVRLSSGRSEGERTSRSSSSPIRRTTSRRSSTRPGPTRARCSGT